MYSRSPFRASVAIPAVLTVLVAQAALMPAARAQGPGVVWAQQFGTSEFDQARGIAVDGTGVYVTGRSDILPGQSSAGPPDGFVRKYAASGAELWTRQLGSPADDSSMGVGVHNGGVYVAGSTFGTFPGQPNNGGFADVFAQRYDAAGNAIWTRQFGASGFDQAFAVAVDGSGVYVAGLIDGFPPGPAFVSNAFLRRYDLDGNEVWTQPFGTANLEQALAVSVDPSGVYVAGDTSGALPGQTNAGGFDAFVRKYDFSGNEIWTRQFGTGSDEQARSLSVGPSGIYVAGWTEGTLPGQSNAGLRDAYVRRYDPNGNLLWTRQFGTSQSEQVMGSAVDASGVYVAGFAEGTLPGQISQGGRDAFVRKYNLNGNMVWTRQLGTAGSEMFFGVSVDASGIYAAGRTDGTLPGHTNAGGFDVFVARLSVPTPLNGVGRLLTQVDALDLRRRVSRRLTATLRVAERVLDDGRRRNDIAAIVTLRIFVLLVEAQRGRGISDTDADILVTGAQEVLALIREPLG